MIAATMTRARMAASSLLLWAMLLAVETLAQLGLKIGSRAIEGVAFGWDWLLRAAAAPWLWVGAFAYLMSFATWMVILRRMALGAAFPLTGLVYVTVLASSALVLGEPVAPLQGAGVALIVGGAGLLGTDSS
jgi:multidrug transporter EmrE-like cation transporter